MGSDALGMRGPWNGVAESGVLGGSAGVARGSVARTWRELKRDDWLGS